MVQFKAGRSWSHIFKQTAKFTGVGAGLLIVGSTAAKAYVTGKVCGHIPQSVLQSAFCTVHPGQVGVQLQPKGNQTKIMEEVLQVGSHWVNPFTTQVVPVDTLPWTDRGTAYIQCKGGHLVKVDLEATMRVVPEGARECIQFTLGRE